MQQRTEDWYRIRAGRITGSRFARVMAQPESKVYKDLIDQLAEERRKGICLDSSYMTPAMRWGVRYEHDARLWYSTKRRRPVQQVSFVVHPKYDYIGVSPDGIVLPNGLVEIKCPQKRTFEDIKATKKVPSRYRWQIQGQLWVCEKEWLDFVCFYPPTQGICIRVRPDPNDFDRLDERCRRAHREVEGRLRRYRQGTVAQDRAPFLPNAANEQQYDPASGASSPDRQGVPVWIWVIIGLILWNVLRVFLGR